MAYTPVVLFMISGNSRLPTFNEISEGDIVETATGVSRTFAISITSEVTMISSNMLNKESAEAAASCAEAVKTANRALTISKAFFILFVKWLIHIQISK